MDKVEYCYVETTSQDQTCIGIRNGEYEGTVFKYGKIGVHEDNDTGEAALAFEYDVVETNGKDAEEFREGKFKEICGDILLKILTEQLEEDETTESPS